MPVRDADKRAIRLHLIIRQVEQMPLIELSIIDGPKPILLKDANNLGHWWIFTVDGFLLLDVNQAKAAGGTLMALRCSRRKLGKPRLPQAEIDRAVENFVTGSDDE